MEFSRKNMEQLFEYLDYKFAALEMFIRSIETRPFDEYSIVILKIINTCLMPKGS